MRDLQDVEAPVEPVPREARAVLQGSAWRAALRRAAGRPAAATVCGITMRICCLRL